MNSYNRQLITNNLELLPNHPIQPKQKPANRICVGVIVIFVVQIRYGLLEAVISTAGGDAAGCKITDDAGIILEGLD